jgi:hypothetical protein
MGTKHGVGPGGRGHICHRCHTSALSYGAWSDRRRLREPRREPCGSVCRCRTGARWCRFCDSARHLCIPLFICSTLGGALGAARCHPCVPPALRRDAAAVLSDAAPPRAHVVGGRGRGRAPDDPRLPRAPGALPPAGGGPHVRHLPRHRGRGVEGRGRPCRGLCRPAGTHPADPLRAVLAGDRDAHRRDHRRRGGGRGVRDPGAPGRGGGAGDVRRDAPRPADGAGRRGGHPGARAERGRRAGRGTRHARDGWAAVRSAVRSAGGVGPAHVRGSRDGGAVGAVGAHHPPSGRGRPGGRPGGR